MVRKQVTANFWCTYRPGPIYQRDSTIGSGRYQSVNGTGGHNNSRELFNDGSVGSQNLRS